MGSPKTMGRTQGGSANTSCLQTLRLEIYKHFSSLISQDSDLGICCSWLKASRFSRSPKGLSHVSIDIDAFSFSQIFLVSDIL